MTTTDTSTNADAKTAEAQADAAANRAALDERRSKWQAAEDGAAQAEKKLALLGERLDANAEKHDADEAALQAAVDRQAELKRAIKTSAEQRETLRRALSKAQREVEDARKRAQTAEAKYDKSLLAELLAAQKVKDLSAHDGQARSGDEASGTTAPARKQPSPVRRRANAPVSESTARKTAAGVTARKARA